MTLTAHNFILAMAKHLPPSAATLRLLDVNGAAEEALRSVRPDVDAVPVAAERGEWSLPESVDAVVAYNAPLDDGLLHSALAVLRPGGRLIVVDPSGSPDESLVRILEAAGYVRILVEAAVDGLGVLMRGEKPHTTDDTLERIRQVAEGDAVVADFASYTGRYVYLIIRQTPNKPAWALREGETVQWEAVALDMDGMPTLLAFSGLPRAVGFMQPAVLEGRIRDVSKVAKFSREIARRWAQPALLNPPVEMLSRYPTVMISIDSATAEAAGE